MSVSSNNLNLDFKIGNARRVGIKMGSRKNKGIRERKNANVNYLGLIVIPIVAIALNFHPIKAVKNIYQDIIQTSYRPSIVGVNQSELTVLKADLSPKRVYESKSWSLIMFIIILLKILSG